MQMLWDNIVQGKDSMVFPPDRWYMFNRSNYNPSYRKIQFTEIHKPGTVQNQVFKSKSVTLDLSKHDWTGYYFNGEYDIFISSFISKAANNPEYKIEVTYHENPQVAMNSNKNKGSYVLVVNSYYNFSILKSMTPKYSITDFQQLILHNYVKMLKQKNVEI